MTEDKKLLNQIEQLVKKINKDIIHYSITVDSLRGIDNTNNKEYKDNYTIKDQRPNIVYVSYSYHNLVIIINDNSDNIIGAVNDINHEDNINRIKTNLNLIFDSIYNCPILYEKIQDNPHILKILIPGKINDNNYNDITITIENILTKYNININIDDILL